MATSPSLNNFEELYKKATLLHQSGKLAEAEILYRQILSGDSKNAECLHALGLLFASKGNITEGAEFIKKAINSNQNSFVYYLSLGFVLCHKPDFAGAEEAYKKAISLNSSHAESYMQLGLVQRDMGKITEAINNFRTSLAIMPNNVSALLNIGNAIFDSGEVSEAIKYYKKAAEMLPENPDILANLIMAMHYDEVASRDEIFALSKKWAEKFAPKNLIKTHHQNSKDLNRKIRIGYVSADFKAHPIGFYTEGVFLNHDKNKFEIYCYANQNYKDRITQNISSKADKYISIKDWPDEKVIREIEEDKIDILIDLSGYSSGNRLGVFARKPAPIQMSWIGYFDTTGMEAIDYIISDKFLIPEGDKKYYIEKPLRLPVSYVAMQPPEANIVVAELPAKKNGYITFASFNNSRKLNKNLIKIWAEILDKVPNSKLYLKSKAFIDKKVQEKFLTDFAKNNIAKERIIFSGHTVLEDMFSEYNKVDIALDTFPFNGNTTTSHALWMGVPVVTLSGTNYVSKMSESILNAIGLPEFITKTKEEYINKAVSLAENIEKLQEIRLNLRNKFENSNLSGVKKFTGELEELYKKAWQGWCAK